MYHIFFIYLPVSGYLGFFHFLAIVSSAEMNMGMKIPLRSCFQFFWINTQK